MRIALATALLLLAAGCASAPPRQPPPPPAPPDALAVWAVRVSTPPMVDGIANDAAWAAAPGPEGVPEVILNGAKNIRSVIHGGSIYILLQWEGPRSTDSQEAEAGITLARKGPLSSLEPDPWCTEADQWHWRSEAETGGGEIVDRWFAIAPPPVPFDRGLPRDDEDGDGRSAHDVVARGRWSDGLWTIEIARALRTGHEDDVDLDGLSEIPVKIVLTARSGGARVFIPVPVLRLLLPPPLPVDHQGPFPEPRGDSRERR